MAKAEEDFIVEAKRRYDESRKAWTDRRAEALLDMKYCNVVGGQWDASVKAARENGDPPRPALEFNALHMIVSSLVNAARQERPSIKITPGDEGVPETATVLEDKVRHLQYASQADVAYDGAVEAAATGGFGYYEVTREYTDGVTGNSHHLEPRIRRILDPMTVYPDSSCMEPDFSDMKWCHIRIPYKRKDQYKAEFGIEPTPFDAEQYDSEWGDEDTVWVSKYWWIEESTRRHVQLSDGQEGYADEFEELDEDEVLSERDSETRKVYCSIIDGSRRIEPDIEWPGEWIPVIPVLGREVVVDGKRILLSAIRFCRDASKLKNVTLTDAAESLGSANRSLWIGPIGSFKDGKWRNGKRNMYLEYTPVLGADGQPTAPPTFNTYEPPITGLMNFGAAMSNEVKTSSGYVDDVVEPSQDTPSGVAVERRTDQKNLANFHFKDNLVRSQWHAGRVVVDLLMHDIDTPRAITTRNEQGKTSRVPVTMEMEDGEVPTVPGFEDLPHHRIDVGEYGVDIQSGPSFEAKQDEERKMITDLMAGNPQILPLYGDLFFAKLGYSDLAERAKLLLPPAIQQAEAAKAQGQDPQAAAQNAALNAKIQQLTQAVQKLLQDKQGKIISAQAQIQGKTIQAHADIQKQKLATMGDLLVEQQKHSHDAAKHTLSEHTDAIEHMMDMLHESEMAPPQPGEQGYVDPAAQAAQEAAAAQQPQGAAQ